VQLEYRILDAGTSDPINAGTLSIHPPDEGQMKSAWRTTHGGREIENTVLDEQFGTLSWRSYFPETGYDFVGERRGDTVFVEGLFEGRPVKKANKIDHRPFYYDWKLGLVGFVRSNDEKRQFWVLRPDNQKMYVFEARREDVQTIEVNGKDVEAVRVNWGLTGIMRPFFNGDMWFRVEDGLFMRGEQAGRITELIAG